MLSCRAPGAAAVNAFRLINVLLVVAGCGSSYKAPFLDDETCPFRVHGSQEQGVTVQCGYLDTYEEHDTAKTAAGDLRRVQVPYLLFVSSADTTPIKDRAVIVNLAGGPGQSWRDLGLESIRKESSAKFSKDVLFVEQRGTGISKPKLACPEQRAGEDNTAYIQKCIKTLEARDIKLEAYNTKELALDVGDLHKLLGHNKMILSGVSYGTAWALEIMRTQSDRLAGVLLDSVVTPTIAPLSESATVDERAITRLFVECQNNPTCVAEHGDISTKFIELLRFLEQTPKAVENSQEVFTAQAAMSVLLNQLEADPLSVPNFIGELDARIRAPDPLNLTVPDNPFEGGLSNFAFGQYMSVACSDSQFVTQAQVEADRANVRESLRPYVSDVSELLRICQLWPYKRRDPGAFSAVVSDVPTLIFSGLLDLRTPPEWGREAAATLSRATVVEVPGIGHNVTAWGIPCVSTLVGTFYRSPSTIDASCAANITVEFDARTVAREAMDLKMPRNDLVSKVPKW